MKHQPDILLLQEVWCPKETPVFRDFLPPLVKVRNDTRSPASAGIANRPLVFWGIFLIFGSNTPTWSVENQLHY